MMMSFENDHLHDSPSAVATRQQFLIRWVLLFRRFHVAFLGGTVVLGERRVGEDV